MKPVPGLPGLSRTVRLDALYTVRFCTDKAGALRWTLLKWPNNSRVRTGRPKAYGGFVRMPNGSFRPLARGRTKRGRAFVAPYVDRIGALARSYVASARSGQGSANVAEAVLGVRVPSMAQNPMR